MSENILEVRDLVVHFETDDGVVKAINGLNFSIGREKTLGLVGETGAGKTTTALSILNLVPNPPGKIKSGSILLDGRDVLQMSDKELEQMRGNDVAMGRVDVAGPEQVAFLQHVLSSNVLALDVGQAQYCIIPDERGCAVDDAYLYRFEEGRYFLVINAGNIDKDLEHLQREAKAFDVTLTNVSDRWAAIAVQGPESKKLLMTLSGGQALTKENLKNSLGTLTMKTTAGRVSFAVEFSARVQGGENQLHSWHANAGVMLFYIVV